jgi:hypothetical protein
MEKCALTPNGVLAGGEKGVTTVKGSMQVVDASVVLSVNLST